MPLPADPVHIHHRTLASGIPLGGLGAGTVELRADGCFHDWRITNDYPWSGHREDEGPDAWSEDGFLALRVRRAGQAPVARLLYDDDKRSRATAGWYDYAAIYNYPFLRNIERITFRSRPPFADLDYADSALPVTAHLRAFTPLVPFSAADSGLPLAFLELTLRNPSDTPVEVSALFSARNLAGHDREAVTLVHEHRTTSWGGLLAMGAEDLDPAHRTAGTMALGLLTADPAGPAAEDSFLPAWTDGRGLTGFPNAAAPGLSQLWYPFRDEGRLAGGAPQWRRSIRRRPLLHGRGVLHGDRQAGWRWRGALARRLTLLPGHEATAVFLLAWHFPNHRHYSSDRLLGHAYAERFADAPAVAAHAAARHAELASETSLFADNLRTGNLPPWLGPTLAAQLTTFNHAFWWTRDGDVAAWEGMACCQIIPNAHTHWSSWAPLLFFPELYRIMKRRCGAYALADAANTAGGGDPGTPAADGGPTPDGSCGCGPGPRDTGPATPFLASEDGHRSVRAANRGDDLGGWFENRWRHHGYTREDFAPGDGRRPRRRGWLFVASAAELWRDWTWTGDRSLLDELWPVVRDHLLARLDSPSLVDGLPGGMISFTTYDHWFPPETNCYRGTMWLADLRAGAALAAAVGETDLATRLAAAADRGAATFEQLYWNGSYYAFAWDPRRQQRDDGCLADQVSGHLYLRLTGLDPVHDADRVRAALRAVHLHNRRPHEGLLNGADPAGRDDWTYFARFSADGSDESRAGQWVTPWTGTEYYVAAVMAAEGLVDEALDVMADVHERYTCQGLLNNHLECGEHYFRPLVAWALLPALLGLVPDVPRGSLTIAPRWQPHACDAPFLLPGAWGRLTQHRHPDGRQETTLHLIRGHLTLRELVLEAPSTPTSARITLDTSPIPAHLTAASPRATLTFPTPLTLAPGQALAVTLS